MITINLKGGLGNQLFQLYTLISYSLETNNPFFVPDVEELGVGSGSSVRPTYWSTILKRLNYFRRSINSSKFRVLKEKDFHYNKLQLFDRGSSIILDGYFQSPKYFEKYKEQISKMLQIEEMRMELKTELNLNLSKSGFMHFRRGDYLNLQHVHPVLTVEYYKKAYKLLDQDCECIYVFSEKDDLPDVERIINDCEITCEIRYVSHEMPDYKQLLFMSLFPSNRVIANSSFSYWGAYLGDSGGKTIYPLQWFGLNIIHNIKDLPKESWMGI